MSDTNAVLNEVLLKALNAVEKGGDFVVEQAPDVVQQLLTWTLVSSCAWAVIGAVMIAVGVKLIRWADNTPFSNDLGAPAAISGALLFAGGIPTMLINASVALKVWLAPKIFLIEYTASLVK